MGPAPDDPPKPPPLTDGDSEENLERDGWHIGFQVEMNGLGMENIAPPEESDNDSDGYEGPGDGSDAEDAAIRRAGYVQLPMAPGHPSDDGDHADDEDIQTRESLDEEIARVDAPAPGLLPAAIKNDFEAALKSSEKVHLKDDDLDLGERPSLNLSAEKIDAIKNIASKISLSPPSWAKEIDDSKLKEIFHSLRSKNV